MAIDPTTGLPVADPTVITNFAEALSTSFEHLNTVIAKLSTTFETIFSKFTKIGGSQSQITDNFHKQAAGANLFTNYLIGAGNAFDNFTSKSANTQLLTDQLKQAGQAGEKTAGIINNLSKVFEVQGFTKGPKEFAGDFVTRVAAGADQFLKLKNNYVLVQGASGGLSDSFIRAGGNLQNLNTIVQKHGIDLTNIARETGNSTNQVSGYWEKLATAIPGAADKQIESGELTGKTYNYLSATMRLAAGTGRDVESTIKDLTKIWEAYGLEGNKALEFTAQISEVNNKLGLRMGDTSKFIDENISAFKGLTDGGNNAISVLNDMYESFRKTGLSSKESIDIIGKMTSELGKLTLGQKAFMSAQAGGPGGLRGAIQIEQQIRKGDIEGVFKNAEKALRAQFGGKIVTQAEATTSEQSAAQFQRQRALITSGAFGIKATDDQATRILEAFKNGTSATKELRSGQDVLKETLTRGEQIQKDGTNILSDALRDIEKEQIITNKGVFDIVQKMGGPQSGFARILETSGSKANQELAASKLEKNTKAPLSPINEVGIRKDLTDKLSLIGSSILRGTFDTLGGAVSSLKKSDQVQVQGVQSKLTSSDIKIRIEGEKELQDISSKVNKDLQSKQQFRGANNSNNEQLKFGRANKEDIDNLQLKLNILNEIKTANETIRRGEAVGLATVRTATVTATTPAQGVENKIGDPRSPQAVGPNRSQQSEREPHHTFDVTFRGLCVDCGNPVHPDAVSQAHSDGASGTSYRRKGR